MAVDTALPTLEEIRRECVRLANAQADVQVSLWRKCVVAENHWRRYAKSHPSGLTWDQMLCRRTHGTCSSRCSRRSAALATFFSGIATVAWRKVQRNECCVFS